MVELQYLGGGSHMPQTIAIASIVFVALYFLPRINYRAQLAKLPAFSYDQGSEKRATYLKSARSLYSNGYQQFKNKVYRIATSDGVENVVVPPVFLPELRKLPDSVLSLPKSIADFMYVKYTKLDTDDPLSAHTVKADLTPALVRLNPMICGEVDEATKAEMPPCEDWTPVYIYMKLVRIVAKVSGRVFVGPDLCKDEQYLDSGINYTMELIGAQRKIKEINPWLRPFLAPRLPEVKSLRKREQMAKDFLAPIIQARRDAEKDPEYQKPDDMLQWFMNRGAEYGKDTVESFAKIQLGITFAAIHTTSLTATNILYTLAVDPQSIQPLREEIRAAMANNGGIITSRALQQMEKLDSYMKETFRFYPPGFTSFTRKVVKGFTLSNGQYIPAGANVEVASDAIYQDPSIYPDSDKFDGFRFYKLRQAGGAINHARNQFVTSNEENLGFGYGRHACPGRFFAANEIKMILARIILEYDFKNADGTMERYPNKESGRSTNPDAAKALLFKKAEV